MQHEKVTCTRGEIVDIIRCVLSERSSRQFYSCHVGRCGALRRKLVTSTIQTTSQAQAAILIQKQKPKCSHCRTPTKQVPQAECSHPPATLITAVFPHASNLTPMLPLPRTLPLPFIRNPTGACMSSGTRTHRSMTNSGMRGRHCCISQVVRGTAHQDQHHPQS